jgi:hypothetical protein
MKTNSKILRLLEIAAIIAALYHVAEFVFTTPNKWLVVSGITTAVVILCVVFLDPASFLRRLVRRVRRVFDRQPYVTWFVERDAAKPDMLLAWRSQRSLVFVGLSQRTLATYLSDELSTGRP